MIIPIDINLQDEYCKKCKFLYISSIRTEFTHLNEVNELIKFIEENPKLSEDTINYYQSLGIKLEDMQNGYATAYTIGKLVVDLLNIIDKGGMYDFYCIENSKYCQSIGYTCFYD